ncbi:MAG: succinyldiaminopimelate transaminase [Steroidobacteraceae bacterium]
MNPGLSGLQPYPFERLSALLSGVHPPPHLAPIPLPIGEPRHPPPPAVLEALATALPAVSRYPTIAGRADLRQACASWAERRFGLRPGQVDADTMLLPVNGTREALFAFAQVVIHAGTGARVCMPNPGYQIYEGAALLAGAAPHYLPTDAAGHWLPDLESITPSEWQACALLYLCSPGNPTGAVMDLDYLCRAIELAEKHDFVIASDECYSEIYFDESSPPPGLLQACAALGNDSFRRCIVFHSLSKRSNLPGLRSGFVAGDAKWIESFRRYRTYHGCSMPEPVQQASLVAWSDESHVRENRALYRQKFAAFLAALDGRLMASTPAGAFYLWPAVGGDDEAFARALYQRTAVSALPGSYLGRGEASANPGCGHLRLSLVASLEDCVEAAMRIRAFVDAGGP